jgi:glycosyltransferase involved in cell wall biosynthesis
VSAAAPVRIAILTSHPVPYHVAFYRELARRPGVDLEVLYSHDHGVKPTFDHGFGREVKFDVPLLEGYAHEFPHNYAREPSLKFFGQVNPAIPLAVSRHEYDAIVVHGYMNLTSVLTLLAPRAGRKRTRVLMRSESTLLNTRSMTTRAAKEVLIRGLFRSIDHFLAIGTKSKEYFEAYGVPASRISIAPYTVENADFFERSADARRDPGSVRRRLGLPDDRPLFLYCSKVLPHKRPLDVLRAFAIARNQARCALAFVGDGAQLPELRDEIRKLGTEDVYVLGFKNQSELPAIYGASDVFIQASEFEPWGMVVNEAMACGAAVCASDQVGSAYDLVRDNGAMFPVGDVERLASLLARWARDPAEIARMKRASLDRMATWSPKETADGVIEGVRAALERR